MEVEDLVAATAPSNVGKEKEIVMKKKEPGGEEEEVQGKSTKRYEKMERVVHEVAKEVFGKKAMSEERKDKSDERRKMLKEKRRIIKEGIDEGEGEKTNRRPKTDLSRLGPEARRI